MRGGRELEEEERRGAEGGGWTGGCVEGGGERQRGTTTLDKETRARVDAGAIRRRRRKARCPSLGRPIEAAHRPMATLITIV
jgi:hypothetical protein